MNPLCIYRTTDGYRLCFQARLELDIFPCGKRWAGQWWHVGDSCPAKRDVVGEARRLVRELSPDSIVLVPGMRQPKARRAKR